MRENSAILSCQTNEFAGDYIRPPPKQATIVLIKANHIERAIGGIGWGRSFSGRCASRGPRAFSGGQATHFLRASGQAMIELGIFDNDILVVDCAVISRHGYIVVAVIDGDFGGPGAPDVNAGWAQSSVRPGDYVYCQRRTGGGGDRRAWR